MSGSHSRATAQNFPDFAQNLESFMRKPFFFFFLPLWQYYAIFGVIFALFLAQNFKTKVLTTQKIYF